MQQVVRKARRRVAEEANRYTQGKDLPMAGYAAALGSYALTSTALLGLGHLSGRRLPTRTPWGDLGLAGVATFKLSRSLAKDPVTSPLRAPFATAGEVTGPSELTDEPRRGGVATTVGELFTCPFCLSQWVATGLVAGTVLAPRLTRLVTATFSVVAVSDFLQFGYAWAEQHA